MNMDAAFVAGLNVGTALHPSDVLDLRGVSGTRDRTPRLSVTGSAPPPRV